MARIERISCYIGESLPARFGPQSDLVVMDLDRLPPMPSLATWAAEAGVPVLAASRQPVDGLRVAILLTDGGQVAGWQGQTHRPPGDTDPPVLRDDLNVFEVDGTRIAAVLGADAAVPEVGRAFTLMGAELLIGFAQVIPPTHFSPLWRTVQQNQVLGLQLRPHPHLLLPCEAHPAATGYERLEPTGSWYRADVPWAEWRRLRQQDPLLAQLNPAAYLASAWLRETEAPDGP